MSYGHPRTDLPTGAGAGGRLRLEVDDLSRDAVRGLLAEHLADMFATSPPESVHALDLAGLTAPDVTFWSAWSGEDLVGCVALKELDAAHGEVKSMRTSRAARNRGVGSVLVRHVVEEARRRGYARLSLETGTEDFFAPARRLYARHGFAECPPFADYAPDPHSVFMTLPLR